MRGNYIALAAASMVVLASCGSKKLSLSNDPIDKAATCAVVSAADARLKAPDGKGDLDFEAQPSAASKRFFGNSMPAVFLTTG